MIPGFSEADKIKKAYLQLVLLSLKFLCFQKMGAEGLRCWCCQSINLIKLVFHHLEYPKDCAKYNDFQKGKEWKEMDDVERLLAQIEYHLALLKDLEKEDFPKIGIVLCNGCHNAVEVIVNKWQNNSDQLAEAFENELELISTTFCTSVKPFLVDDNVMYTHFRIWNVIFLTFQARVNPIMATSMEQAWLKAKMDMSMKLCRRAQVLIFGQEHGIEEMVFRDEPKSNF